MSKNPVFSNRVKILRSLDEYIFIYPVFLFFLLTNAFIIDAEECEENSFITLNEALRYTLENQKEIQVSIYNIKIQEGVLQETAGPFDPLVEGTAFHSRSHDKECGPFCFKFSTDYVALDTSVEKKTRIGTSFAFNAHYRRYSDFSRTKEFTFQIVQPLLRNFLNGKDRQAEIANQLELEAVQWDTLFLISQKIQDTITRYYDAVAANEALDALQMSVKRLESLTRDIDLLVKGNELATNDANQPLATLALIRQQAIQAQFNAYSTKQLLIFAMGEIQESRCSDFESSIRVLDRLPKILDIEKSLTKYIDPLIQQAFVMRFDVLASETRENESFELVKGAKNQTLPQADLFSQVIRHNTKLTAFDAPCTSADFTPAPLFVCRNTEVRLGVSFSVPIFNDAALGALEQRKAIYKESILKTQFLKQNVITNIINLLSSLTALDAEIKEAKDAVELYDLLFENEKKKLVTGFGSVFELLNFETNRINSQLSLIELRHNYLKNMADLHHETGNLIIIGDSYGTICFKNVLEFPLLKSEKCE